MKKIDNFGWIDEIKTRTTIARELINHCRQIKPIWTEDLDAAVRIVLFAVNGGVASRDFNETIFRSIEKLIAKNSLYNTDIIEIAVCILENGYLVPATTSLFTQKHCEIVQKSYTAQQRKIVQAYDQAIKETPIINT